MNPATAIVLGVLLVGGTYLVLRRDEDDSGPAGNQVCGELGKADAKLGLLCSLTPTVLNAFKGLGDAAADGAGDITHATNSTIGRALGKVSGVISSSVFGNCDDNCKRRVCTQIRDKGTVGFFGGVKLNDEAKAKYRPGCADVGIHF